MLSEMVNIVFGGMLSDKDIIRMCKKHSMIYPFEETSIRSKSAMDGGGKSISYGPAGYGYDLRLGSEFKRTRSDLPPGTVIDPKNIDENNYETFVSNDPVLIPPGDTLYGCTKEWLILPDSIQALIVGKSTYARVAVSQIATPINAGFSGSVVLELTNTSMYPVKVYPHEGIALITFMRAPIWNRCTHSYMVAGTFQGQSGVVLSARTKR